MTTQKRAKVGGETGANGEWYDGGKFIATTEHAKASKSTRNLRKQEVAPYKWEVAPNGETSVFSEVKRLCFFLDKNGVPMATPVAYYRVTPEQITAATSIFARYQGGEKWM